MSSRTLAAILLVMLLPAQESRPAKVEKLSEWPALKDTDKEKAMALVAQFRKDEKLHQEARAGLIAFGPAVAPLLLQQVTDRPENINAQLFAVFDAILGPPHASLMARESDKQKFELRKYLVRRLCRFVDPDLAPILKKATKDKDEEVKFCGALGLLALRQKDGLPLVMEHCRTDWPVARQMIGEVLPAARSTECGQWLIDLAAKSSAVERTNALRLARYLATKEQTSSIKPYLDAEDHNVKKEAINALRVIHGEAPMEDLSVFQAIDQAKEWKAKA
ncbi:MAG TPA: HEAT repeat domain-containing protein [Planctomycetota bacterium]|nr:HEAT repeat domain-containing protein [Planctomycetota bacterium]